MITARTGRTPSVPLFGAGGAFFCVFQRALFFPEEPTPYAFRAVTSCALVLFAKTDKQLEYLQFCRTSAFVS